MNPKKSATGLAVATTLAISLGAAGVCYAATDYRPEPLGNDAYTNQVDEVNERTVQGVSFTGSIASQNADTVAEARGLAVTIGSETDDASPILVTNSLGKAVKELAFRTSAETAYAGNALSGALADGESACWFFVYDYADQSYTNSSDVSLSLPQNYLLQVTFGDGTTAEFHNVNMNGVRTLDLRYSADYGVYYVSRTTITNHTPDPTLYYEVNLSEYAGSPEEFNYHVNSGGRMGDLMYTASRGNGWNVGHEPLPQLEDFSIVPPLYGTAEGEGNDGSFGELHWNSDSLSWR